MNTETFDALRDASRGDWGKVNDLELRLARRTNLQPIGPRGTPLQGYRLICGRYANGRMIGYEFARRCPECRGAGRVIYSGQERNFEVTCPHCCGDETVDDVIYTDLLGRTTETSGALCP